MYIYKNRNKFYVYTNITIAETISEKLRPFVKLYNIELGDQEFFTQFISIDILWAHGLHIVPPRRKQSMASAFLCGPTVFCSTRTVFATRGRILFVCSPWESCAHKIRRFTQGEKVVKMLLTHLFCSRLDQEGRQMRRWGVGGTSCTAEPPQMSRRGWHIIAMETQP